MVLRTRAGLLPRLRCGLSICYVRPPAGFTPSALLPTDAVQCRARVVSTKVSVCSRRRPSTLSTTDRILSRACKRVCRGAVCQYRMLGNVAGVNWAATSNRSRVICQAEKGKKGKVPGWSCRSRRPSIFPCLPFSPPPLLFPPLSHLPVLRGTRRSLSVVPWWFRRAAETVTHYPAHSFPG